MGIIGLLYFGRKVIKVLKHGNDIAHHARRIIRLNDVIIESDTEVGELVLQHEVIVLETV